MKIISLVENTTNTDWPTEHGLCLYIETVGHKILFDSGKSELFVENAAKAGVDLSAVDVFVLSHGHYDHGGGLKKFSEVNSKAPIYMNKNAFGLHYHGNDRYIGLNRDWIDDAALQERIVFTDGITKIDDELTIYASEGRKKIVDMGNGGLCVKVGETFVPETFKHEHYLMINEGGKSVLISGCSHQGVINIVDWFKPDVLIGGFHFMKQPLDERLADFAKTLDGYDVDYYTCHCTGVEQYEYIKQFMRRLHYLAEGQIVEISS